MLFLKPRKELLTHTTSVKEKRNFSKEEFLFALKLFNLAQMNFLKFLQKRLLAMSNSQKNTSLLGNILVDSNLIDFLDFYIDERPFSSASDSTCKENFGFSLSKFEDRKLKNIRTDSRLCLADDVFVSLNGSFRRGYDFLPQVWEAGVRVFVLPLEEKEKIDLFFAKKEETYTLIWHKDPELFLAFLSEIFYTPQIFLLLDTFKKYLAKNQLLENFLLEKRWSRLLKLNFPTDFYDLLEDEINKIKELSSLDIIVDSFQERFFLSSFAYYYRRYLGETLNLSVLNEDLERKQVAFLSNNILNSDNIDFYHHTFSKLRSSEILNLLYDFKVWQFNKFILPLGLNQFVNSSFLLNDISLLLVSDLETFNSLPTEDYPSFKLIHLILNFCRAKHLIFLRKEKQVFSPILEDLTKFRESLKMLKQDVQLSLCLTELNDYLKDESDTIFSTNFPFLKKNISAKNNFIELRYNLVQKRKYLKGLSFTLNDMYQESAVVYQELNAGDKEKSFFKLFLPFRHFQRSTYQLFLLSFIFKIILSDFYDNEDRLKDSEFLDIFKQDFLKMVEYSSKTRCISYKNKTIFLHDLWTTKQLFRFLEDFMPSLKDEKCIYLVGAVGNRPTERLTQLCQRLAEFSKPEDTIIFSVALPRSENPRCLLEIMKKAYLGNDKLAKSIHNIQARPLLLPDWQLALKKAYQLFSESGANKLFVLGRGEEESIICTDKLTYLKDEDFLLSLIKED